MKNQNTNWYFLQTTLTAAIVLSGCGSSPEFKQSTEVIPAAPAPQTSAPAPATSDSAMIPAVKEINEPVISDPAPLTEIQIGPKEEETPKVAADPVSTIKKYLDNANTATGFPEDSFLVIQPTYLDPGKLERDSIVGNPHLYMDITSFKAGSNRALVSSQKIAKRIVISTTPGMQTYDFKTKEYRIPMAQINRIMNQVELPKFSNQIKNEYEVRGIMMHLSAEGWFSWTDKKVDHAMAEVPYFAEHGLKEKAIALGGSKGLIVSDMLSAQKTHGDIHDPRYTGIQLKFDYWVEPSKDNPIWNQVISN